MVLIKRQLIRNSPFQTLSNPQLSYFTYITPFRVSWLILLDCFYLGGLQADMMLVVVTLIAL